MCGWNLHQTASSFFFWVKACLVKSKTMCACFLWLDGSMDLGLALDSAFAAASLLMHVRSVTLRPKELWFIDIVHELQFFFFLQFSLGGFCGHVLCRSNLPSPDIIRHIFSWLQPTSIIVYGISFSFWCLFCCTHMACCSSWAALVFLGVSFCCSLFICHLLVSALILNFTFLFWTALCLPVVLLWYSLRSFLLSSKIILHLISLGCFLSSSPCILWLFRLVLFSSSLGVAVMSKSMELVSADSN